MSNSSPLREAVIRRNNVNVRGSGAQTMLFAHGFGCDQTMWRWLLPSFEANYRCVLFDYVGSGQSDYAAFDANQYSNLDGYAQDILDVCEALELTNVILMAHSVSSMIGLLAAVRNPRRISKLIMIGPSPRYLNDAPNYQGGFEREDLEGLLKLMDHNYLGWASQFAPVVMGNPDRAELAQELEHSFCSTDPVTARAFARTTFFGDNRADLGKLTQPTLIMQVRDDDVVPVNVGQFLHESIKNSEFTIIEASGHCPHISHPEATVSAIKAFLETGRAAA